MTEIKAKIYYLISDGEVLIITSEMKCYVKETTKEEDMKIYEQLKDKNINEVDYIELPYGTLASTFTNVKSYKINLETKQLEVLYYTKEELEIMKHQNNEETQDSISSATEISEYIQSQDEETLSTIEDYILEIETNKILNGGM